MRALSRPLPAWILFNATVVGWHIPGAYDATLTNGVAHACEHAMFFLTGLLFWARVIDPGPLRPRLVWPMRIAFTVGAMVVGWVLAITLVVVPHALYQMWRNGVSLVTWFQVLDEPLDSSPLQSGLLQGRQPEAVPSGFPVPAGRVPTWTWRVRVGQDANGEARSRTRPAEIDIAMEDARGAHERRRRHLPTHVRHGPGR